MFSRLAALLRPAVCRLGLAHGSRPRGGGRSSKCPLLSLQSENAKPEGTFQVTMLPGDGVGPELMHAVKEVFKVTAAAPGGTGPRGGQQLRNR